MATPGKNKRKAKKVIRYSQIEIITLNSRLTVKMDDEQRKKEKVITNFCSKLKKNC